MPSASARLRSATAFLLEAPAAVPLLAAFYIVAGVCLVLTDYTLNNEGLLTYYWASWARRNFVAVFFFQKIKPVLAAFYAPVTAAGPHFTLVVHVVVASAIIPMLASIARSLQYKLPNLPALVVAFSPVYFYGGPAGVSNVDGIVGIVLVLYLLCVRRLDFAAGLVVGALPWVRFEIVPFFAAISAYALLTPGHRRLLLGQAVFPLAYIGAGAIYHGDPLWIAAFPASAPFDPDNPIFATQHIGLRYFLEPAAVLTPLAALAATLPMSRLKRIERVLLAYLVLTAVMMAVMQFTRMGNFGDAPRYMLHLLPPLALMIGRALEAFWEGQRLTMVRIVFAAALVAWIATRHQGVIPPVLIVACGLVLVIAWRGAGQLAVSIAVGLAVIGPLLPFRSTLNRSEIARYLVPMTEWLVLHRDQIRGPIYTNSQLLDPSLARRRLPTGDIYFMAGIDSAREIIGLTNPNNGQRTAIRTLCETELYGKTLLPPFEPEDLPEGSLLALRTDPRLSRILAPEIWSDAVEVLFETGDFRIARVRARATPEQIERAVELLRSAIKAHGGRGRLVQFGEFHAVSRGVSRGATAFRREVNYRDAENWSMYEITDAGSVGMGFDAGRCWVEDRQVVRECEDEERGEIASQAIDHNAWVLNEIAEDRVRPSAPVAGSPAIRAGNMVLVFDPVNGRIQQIRHGDRVESLTDYRSVEGAWIAGRRVLSIGGNPDLEETWIEITPGESSPKAPRFSDAPADGVVTVVEDSPRIVAWAEVESLPEDRRALVNALDRFVKEEGRKISWADGVLWSIPLATADSSTGGWRVVIGVEAGPPVEPVNRGGFHLEAWPTQRVMTLYHEGDFLSALLRRRESVERMSNRGLEPVPGARWQVLAPRTLTDESPDRDMLQIRIPVD